MAFCHERVFICAFAYFLRVFSACRRFQYSVATAGNDHRSVGEEFAPGFEFFSCLNKPANQQTGMSYNASNSTVEPYQVSDNTLTFIVGFTILILFVVLGMLASAFLCITLKKDPYLWEAERERQLQEQADEDANCKERDKLAEEEPTNDQQSTQI